MPFRGGNGGVPLQKVWNRRRVVYYAILLLLILGELLGKINYIIIIFPEYNIYYPQTDRQMEHVN